MAASDLSHRDGGFRCPPLLDYWNPAQQQSLTLLNAETARAQADRSASTLAAAKSAYAAIFPDLPDDSKKMLEDAKSREALVKVFYTILGSGRRVRFTVKTAYRGDEDEDDTLDVWTPFDDCGYDFQTGETYWYSPMATRIRRRLHQTPARATSGFPTPAAIWPIFTSSKTMATIRRASMAWRPRMSCTTTQAPAPVAGVTVELKSGHGSRFTETGEDGKFVFDGLAAGEYSVNAYGPGFPKT